MAVDISHAAAQAVSSDAMEDASRQRADAAWVAGIRGGDEDAFSNAFRAYVTPLVACARRVVSSDASARDIVMEVFLQLWRNRLALSADVRLSAHLHEAVHSAALNAVAGGHADAVPHARDTDTGWPPAMRTPHQAPHDALERAEAKEAVRRAYGTLPARLRQVIELRWCHGRSHEAIARELRVPVTSVDSYVAKGMRLLREALRGVR